MAQIYNINALSYTTKENPEWFTRALFGGKLITNGNIRVLTDIKGDELLNQIDLENKILQIDGKDCAWTPNQVIKLSDKRVSVKTYKINLEQCINVLENKRTLYMMSPGAANEELPAELEDATLALLAIGLSNEIEEMLIAGDESKDPNSINGMLVTLLNSTEAIKVVGPVLTAANIQATFEAGYAAVPERVLQAEDAGTLQAFISFNTRRLLRSTLATTNSQVIAPNWTVDDTDKKNPRIYYLGVELVVAKGMGKDDIVFIDQTNAFLLTDLMSDLEEINMGQFPAPNEDKVWIKGRMRIGFAIPFEDEAVIISPKVTTAQAGANSDGGLSVVPNSLVFAQVGEAKTVTVVTLPGITPNVSAAPSGFTIAKGATSLVGGVNVTVVTVTAAAWNGQHNPRTAEFTVSLPGDVDRNTTVTLDQHAEDIDTIIE